MGIEKSLYDEMLRSEKTSVGVSVISSVAPGCRDISFSPCVMFSAEVPVLISFIFGISRVNVNPGFIEIISVEVWFVSSLKIVFSFISNVLDMVVDLRVSVSL